MGVDVEVLSPGDGQTYPKTGQTVVVHYTGTLNNGKIFDSSRGRGVPFKFRIGKGEVIKGWDQGVAQMCVGERARLTCSPDFAYGSRGHPGIKFYSNLRRGAAESGTLEYSMESVSTDQTPKHLTTKKNALKFITLGSHCTDGTLYTKIQSLISLQKDVQLLRSHFE